MKSAQVSQLKATLSQYLARVKAGEELIVMERGRPIAKLVPMPRHKDTEAAQLADLVRAGLIRSGSGKLPAGFWKLPRPKDRKRRALHALLAERAEGR
jgi:prevent-host-death family protein